MGLVVKSTLCAAFYLKRNLLLFTNTEFAENIV